MKTPALSHAEARRTRRGKDLQVVPLHLEAAVSPRLRVRQTADGVLIDVRVTPRASRTAIEGVREGRLVVRVTAAPVDDAANDAVVRAIAEAFDVPKSRVAISAGATGRNKTIAITGLRPEHAAAAIEARTR